LAPPAPEVAGAAANLESAQSAGGRQDAKRAADAALAIAIKVEAAQLGDDGKKVVRPYTVRAPPSRRRRPKAHFAFSAKMGFTGAMGTYNGGNVPVGTKTILSRGVSGVGYRVIVLLVCGGLVVALVLFVMGVYNGLVVARNRYQTRSAKSTFSSNAGTISSPTWWKSPRAT